MFKSLKLKNFGEHIKQIRLNCGLSQAEVGEQACLSRDTIRRIEQGEVVVRFDTLVLLSEIYKRDLLEDLRYFSDSTVLFTYYHRLDELIVNYDVENLRQLRQDFQDFCHRYEPDYPIIVQTMKQFENFLEGISSLISGDIEESIDWLIQAMQTTNPEFRLESLFTARFSLFEQRILIVLAQAIARQGNLARSNQILHFLHDKLIKITGSSSNEKQLIIKILGNLADNYHLLEQDQQVIEIAQSGINYCNDHHLMYGLSIFFYRLGIAKFHLEQSDFITSLKHAICLLRIQDKTELAAQYIDITLEKYQIDLSDTAIPREAED